MEKLNLTFNDFSTVIDANMLKAFQNKINELVNFANGSSGGGTTPTAPSAPTITIDGTSATISAVSGATIKYTTNGTNPSASVGTTYSGAITLSASCTIKAVAIKDGLVSSVASKSYTHQEATPEVTPEVPTITLDADTKKVSLSASSGLTIKYSTNGETPSANYSAPFDVSGGAKIISISTNGNASSEVPPITVIYRDGGKFEFVSSIDGIIRYRAGGPNPGVASTAYSGPVELSEGITKLCVYSGNSVVSDIVTIEITA